MEKGKRGRKRIKFTDEQVQEAKWAKRARNGSFEHMYILEEEQYLNCLRTFGEKE